MLTLTLTRVTDRTRLVVTFSPRSDGRKGRDTLRTGAYHRGFKGGLPFVYPIVVNFMHGSRSNSAQSLPSTLTGLLTLTLTSLSHPGIISLLSPGLPLCATLLWVTVYPGVHRGQGARWCTQGYTGKEAYTGCIPPRVGREAYTPGYTPPCVHPSWYTLCTPPYVHPSWYTLCVHHSMYTLLVYPCYPPYVHSSWYTRG